MKEKEFSYLSSDGKTKIHAVKWIPDGEVVAILQIAHGVTEHILRYQELAEYFTSKGIMVVGNDLLGHGKSIGTKKMYFGPAGSWDYLVKDFDICREMVLKEYSQVPYFILGFSLGSFVVRNYLIDYDSEIAGAIIVGTGYTPEIQIKLAKFIANGEARKYGEENSTSKIKSLTFDTYNKRFRPNHTDYDWLSLSTKNLEEYTNDPLRGECMSAGLFRELLSGMFYTGKLVNIEKMNKDNNVLFLSGTDDPVGSFKKGFLKFIINLKRLVLRMLILNFILD